MSRIILFVALIVACHPIEASAQVQAVQQPVVRQFGVQTSVSVPDRGRAHLGGVSKGTTGRNTYGPLRSGTSSGAEYSSASQSVSAYIFDFEAMDQAMLESANRDVRARADKTKINPRAERAWQSLQARQAAQRTHR